MSAAAVSYTHLDVYKRQHDMRPPAILFQQIRCGVKLMVDSLQLHQLAVVSFLHNPFLSKHKDTVGILDA